MTQRPTVPTPITVFVTGVNGFVGAALCARLRELGAEVRGVARTAEPGPGVVAGSTTDPQPWAHLLADVDVVVHTAALVSLVAPYPLAWQVNVYGTGKVLAAAAAAGVRRFVHISSVAAFGFDFPDGVEESYPSRVSGLCSYHDTKINAEAVVLAAHAAGEIDVTVIRPTDVYGPRSVWIREPLAMIKAGQMVVPNGGRGIFHPVFIDNLVDGILLAVTSDAASGQILTIGDAQTLTFMEYFGRLADLAGGTVRTLPTGVAVRLAGVLGPVQRHLGRPNQLGSAAVLALNRPGGYSIAKARSMLGYEPIVPFDEGMRRSEEWARAHGLI